MGGGPGHVEIGGGVQRLRGRRPPQRPAAAAGARADCMRKLFRHSETRQLQNSNQEILVGFFSYIPPSCGPCQFNTLFFWFINIIHETQNKTETTKIH